MLGYLIVSKLILKKTYENKSKRIERKKGIYVINILKVLIV